MRKGWEVLFGRPTYGATTEITQETYLKAWRAGFSVSDEGDFLLPIPFGCKRDAEACVRYMKTKIPSPELLSLDEFKEQFGAIGGSRQETVNHLVATCCQW